jgi:hypothetical protein
MRRSFSITAGCSPDVSLSSINRRKPLWTTFLIFMPELSATYRSVSSDAIRLELRKV